MAEQEAELPTRPSGLSVNVIDLSKNLLEVPYIYILSSHSSSTIPILAMLNQKSIINNQQS